MHIKNKSYLFTGLILLTLCYLQPTAHPSSIIAIGGTEAAAQHIRRVPAMKLSVHKVTERIQEALNTQDFETAKILITQALQDTTINAYEITVMLQLASQIAIQEKNTPAVIQLYHMILDHRMSIPLQLELQMIDMLSLLHSAEKDWHGALEYSSYIKAAYKRLYPNEPTPAKIASAIAQYSFQLGDYVTALENANIALKAHLDDQNDQKKELYHRIRISSLYQLQRMNDAALAAQEFYNILSSDKSCGILLFFHNQLVMHKNLSSSDCHMKLPVIEPTPANLGLLDTSQNNETNHVKTLPPVKIPHVQETKKNSISNFTLLSAFENAENALFQNDLQRISTSLDNIPQSLKSRPYETALIHLYRAAAHNISGGEAQMVASLTQSMEVGFEFPEPVKAYIYENLIFYYLANNDFLRASPLIKELIANRGMPFDCAILNKFNETSPVGMSRDTDKYHVCASYIEPAFTAPSPITKFIKMLRDNEQISLLPLNSREITQQIKFPSEALQNNITKGYVILELSTTKKGKVIKKEIKVIESSPQGVFDTTAISLAKKFKYPTLIINGKKRGIRKIRHKFSYSHETSQPH